MREIMLIIHFLGMAMAVGTIMVFMFVGVAKSKLDRTEVPAFNKGLFRLNIVGHIGLTLSLLSGGYLMTPFWRILGNQPLLIIKLSAFVLLLGTMSMISVAARRAREDKTGTKDRKIMLWTRISFVLGIVIIVLATYVFR